MARAKRETALAPTNNRVMTIGEVMDGEEGRYEIPQIDIPPAVDDGDDSAFDEIATLIEQVNAEVGGASENAFINAFRLVDKEEVYLARYAAKDFNLDKLRGEYGGGLFRVRGFCPRPPPHNGVRRFMSRDVRIEAPKEAPPVDNAVLAAINTMNTNFEKTMTAFAGALSQLAQPKQDSRKEMLQEMLMFKELFSNNAQPVRVEPERDTFQELDRMLTLQQKIQAISGGSGGGEISYMPMLMEMAKPLLAGVMEQQKNNKLQQTAVKQNPAPQLPEAAPVESTKQPEVNEMDQIKTFGLMILNAAKNGHDTVTYANMMLDNLPDEALDQLLNDPQWFEKLAEKIPEAVNYKPWFVQLYNDINEMLTEPENTDTSAETPAGIPNVAESKT